MLTKNIRFKNFKFNKDDKKIKKDLKILLNTKSEIIRSLTPHYKYAYSKKLIKKIKKKPQSILLVWEDLYLGPKLFMIF